MKNNDYISIIIVNYINYSLTIKCIESILEKNILNKYEIIVIDNNSPNLSYEELTFKYKNVNKVKVIKNESNSGFGNANNLGVKESNGNIILILNPDIIVLDNAIDEMINMLKSNERIGIVSGKLLNEDGSLQYSCRRVLSFSKFLQSRTPLSKFIDNNKKELITSEYLMKDMNHDNITEVEWVMGACMMIYKDLFLDLGGFSKEYFMYFEDVDLCCKVRAVKKKVIYLPNAKMIHLHRQESTKKINKMTLIHLLSMIKFYFKYYTGKFR